MDNTKNLIISLLIGAIPNYEMKLVNRSDRYGKDYSRAAVRDTSKNKDIWMLVDSYNGGPYTTGNFMVEHNGVLLQYDYSSSVYSKRASDMGQSDLLTFINWLNTNYDFCIKKHEEISKSLDKTNELLDKNIEELKDSFVLTANAKKLLTAYKFKEYNMLLFIKIMKKTYNVSALFIGREDGLHYMNCPTMRKNMNRTLGALRKVTNSWVDYHTELIKSTYPTFLVDAEKKPKKEEISA